MSFESINEWQLQEVLTDRWLPTGIEHQGESLFLLAWEVMFDTWTINDNTKDWTKPSIDFIALDESGTLVCIELKRRIAGRKSVWSALAQVTRRALLMSASYTPEKLRRAHDLCGSGEHGRTASASPGSLEEVIENHFGTKVMLPASPNPPIRRVLAMTGHGPSLPGIVLSFNTAPLDETLAQLMDLYSTNSDHGGREIRRLAELVASDVDLGVVAAPVELLILTE